MTPQIRCEVYHGIQSVDANRWNHIVKGHPYAGADWCIYGEAVLGSKGYYVILLIGDRPVGGACFWLRHQEQLPFSNSTLRGLVERYLERHPLLICRTAPSTNHTGLFLPASPDMVKPAIELIRTTAKDIAQSNGASFILFDYLKTTDTELGWDGFTQLRGFLDVGTKLKIEWDTFEGYLTHLKSSSLSRRKWLKRHIKESVGVGIQVRFDSQPVDLDTAIRLHKNVERQYGETPYPYTEKVLREACALPGAIWMSAHYQNRMVASELLLYDARNRVCTPVLYGRDYQTEHVYFYTYYEVIRYVIEELCAELIVGNSGAYDFKRHLGFELDQRNNLVFSSTMPVLQTIGGYLARLAE